MKQWIKQQDNDFYGKELEKVILQYKCLSHHEDCLKIVWKSYSDVLLSSKIQEITSSYMSGKLIFWLLITSIDSM